MNVISLFTGVGGFDLGLERAGHRIVAQCEADEKARAVLRRHWPDVPIHEDVCGFDAEWCEQQGIASDRVRRLQPNADGKSDTNDTDGVGGSCVSVDLVCGGFPCQDLSVAGKRAGLAGERSGLFFEAARISDLVLGDGGWILIENVPGLLSSNGGRDFAVVLATLADLGFHDLAWRVLDSRYFGVPQRRRRVFILARRASGRRAAEVLLEPESGGGNHQASREARARVASTLSRGSSKPGVSAPGRRQEDDENLVANSLDQRRGGADDNDAQANHLVAPAVTSKWRKGSGGPAGDECQNLVSPPPDTDGMRTPPGIPGRVDDSVTAFHATQEPIHSGDHFPALGAQAYLAHNGRGAETATSPFDPRPDGPRYAQMGNAVSVPVAQWIGERLRDFG